MRISSAIIATTITTASLFAATTPVATSTIADCSGVEVTIYNDDLGLIKEKRNVALTEGRNELRFGDVAATIRPATVTVKPTSEPASFQVLEQNYEYDLISPSKLLEKFVGKPVKINDYNSYTDKTKMVDATLVSNNEGPVYKIGNDIWLGYPGQIILPQIPENLVATPTLTWICNSAKKKQELELSYLASGIAWSADYILVLDASDTQGDMTGWVTLNNNTGTTFNNATLKLVAGEVNQVQPEQNYGGGYRMQKAMMAAPMMMEDASVKEESFFEYHLYTLPFATTIKNNQSKQVNLLTAPALKTLKVFTVDGGSGAWNYRSGEEKTKLPVNVSVVFKNAKENKLGIALPKGVVRVYKKDAAGSQIFAGEDRIAHTPENEEVRLTIGKAFDVIAEKKQTDYLRKNDRTHETAWEITLKNHKKEAAEINLIEHFYGQWKILKSTHPFTKTSAGMGKAVVSVPAGGEVVVSYRVQIEY